MNIKSLFKIAISYWPKEIEVGDKKLHENGGAAIPKLTAIHDEIETKMISANLSHAILQMDWAIYTVLHQLARSTNIIKPHEIDAGKVEKVYIENSRL